MENTEKKFWLSRTFWTNLLVPVVAYFIPVVQDFVTNHPNTVLSIWAGINVALRFLTKGKVTIN
jgi:hypothetical protein